MSTPTGPPTVIKRMGPSIFTVMRRFKGMNYYVSEHRSYESAKLSKQGLEGEYVILEEHRPDLVPKYVYNEHKGDWVPPKKKDRE